MGDRRTPQTFSYFSWVSSGRCRMIVDIQGVDDLYTDPVVHFLPSHESGSFKTADSPVNLGIRGFALFLWSHRYNEIDRLLQLPIFVLSRSEQEARPPEACTIQDLHQGLGLQTSTRDTATRKAETVSLASVRDIDLRATSFASEAKVSADPEPESSKASTALPLELVEAACHFEIAVMYHEGRLSTPGTAAVDRTRAELESAVFHLVEAAKHGLPEALMALARLASDREHEDFLPQVESSENERSLCLALLELAASKGVLHAHGALGRLLADGSYCPRGASEMRVAASHLVAYAEGCVAGAASNENEDGEGAEVLRHEVTSRHGCAFGWEGHGWAAHTAYAKAAELFEEEHLCREEGARSKELWALAAECAMQDPCLAKQAMRYTERAEAEDEEEEEEVAPNESTSSVADRSDEALCVRLSSDLALRFAAFAAGFPTKEAAIEKLLSDQEKAAASSGSQVESLSAAPGAPEQKVLAPVGDIDDDVWGMLG
ncbi:unnamed protein product [Polarella glacialis]|uniref:Alpha-type protein kinase domain-containing protein n=1 Tax=Polarella glacialis TaxID=89957 RepID=A0A813E0B1_POLGL|nr:unnamed protein product [Polarella glacialis]